jgi:glucose/arabinose dehydrogenase
MIPRRLSTAFACLALAAAAASCGGGGGSNDSGGTVVGGSTRIGWDQRASDASELAFLRFAMYVDGTRHELADAACSTPSGSNGFPCTSSLPGMSAGQHSLELASYVIVDGLVVESPKSAPLVVTASTATGATTGSVTIAADAPAVTVPSPTTTRELVTADGARLQVQTLAQVERVSAIAVAEDGSVFVADQGRRLRIVRDGAVAAETDLAIDGAGDESGSVLDLALDPQFARTRFVFAIEAVAGQPSAVRVARYRESGGRLGERAVVFGDVKATPDRPSAALAFGPDGRLYLALDDGGDPESSGRPASYNGKVLRLNADGTTPADQPGASPIYASSLHAPRSVSWDPTSSSLWVADAGARRAARIRSTDRRGTILTSYRLPLADGPASLAVYRGDLIPELQGSLLIAAVEDAPYLLRARIGNSNQSAIGSTERLAVSPDAPVRLVKVGPDGAIYVGTDRDVLRIAPR